MSHVEIIKPTEKLSTSLGGTGYLPPNKPATLAEIDEAIAAAIAAKTTIAGAFVLKVARKSVNWNRPAKTRTLTFPDGQCNCSIIGSTKDWWFVSVTR